MVSENQPDWLPSDWVEVKDKREGKVLCYRNTETGQTFFTKEDVMRYIQMVNISNSPPQPQPMNEDNDLDTETKTVIVKSVKIPEWLPRGWTMELRSRDSGQLVKCFVHPDGKRRFYSKPQVFRYLETVNSSPATQERSNLVNETGENYSQESVASQRDGIPEWLPQGWTMEMKFRGSGITGGRKYKIYIAPGSGHKCFSKPQVFDYLKTLESSPAGQERVTERGPANGLPPGWIRKIKTRKFGVLLKKDPCFIDPSSGYEFRSKRDALRYLETGNIKYCMYRPRVVVNDAACINDTELIKEDISPNGVNGTGEKSSPGHDASQKDGVPEWLPHGWTVEMKVGGSGATEGRKYKRYIAPGSGHKCYSKPQVFDYLKTLNNSPSGRERERVDQLSRDKCSSELVASDDWKSNSIKKPKKADDNSPSSEKYKVIERGPVDGLPPGWIKEVRSKKVGSRMRKDPYFIDPPSGYEFRSKPDALRYLETGGIKNCAIKPKRREGEGTKLMVIKDNSHPSAADTQELVHSPLRKELFPGGLQSSKEGQNIENCAVVNDTASINDTELIKDDISVIERASVDGLPPGWIKEVRSKKTGSQMRNPYFIDPLSGYEFRSKPDALRYLETGDIKNCAIKPKKRELFSGGLALPESTSSKENAIVASESCPNGTATENHSKPGGSVSTDATDILAASGTRSNKSKNKTVTPPPPGRSSKRLKGGEPEIKTDPLFSERAIRSARRGMPKEPEAEREKPANDLAVQLQEVGPGKEIADKPNGEQQTEGKETELLFPFEESLGLDPCLEFAVKTLTEAIPVEDNLVNQAVSQQPWP